MKVSMRGSSFKVMGVEVVLLGLVVFSSLGLGVGRSIMKEYASEISLQVGSLSVNMEFTIIGAALIVIGYEILSFSRNQLVSGK